METGSISNEALLFNHISKDTLDVFESTLCMFMRKNDDLFCEGLLPKLSDYLWSYVLFFN